MTRPARAIRFMETYCRPAKGVGAGRPLKLGGFQKDWLEEALATGVLAAVMAFPKGNGKSTFSGAFGAWALFDDDELGSPQVPIVATTIGQAIRTVYTPLRSMIRSEPELRDRCIDYTAIGATRIYVPGNEGELFPISNDVDGLQGLDPSIAICDELGFQPVASWDALQLAGGKRPRSLIMGLGTPGLDRTNALFHLRELVMAGAKLPGFVFREYAAAAGCDADDRREWRRANPAIEAGFLTEASLETSRALSPEAQFRIFRLGQWVDGTEGWLGADGLAVWRAGLDRYPMVAGAPTWAGVDVGIKRDSSAVVIVQRRPDGRFHATARIWVPTRDEPVDVTDVMGHLRALSKAYKLNAISFDPRFFDVPAKMLHDEGLQMVEIPQSPERMTPIIGSLYEMLRTNAITHEADPAFEMQILAAMPRYNERGFTLQKSKSRGRIDGAIALGLALDRALHPTPARPRVVVL